MVFLRDAVGTVTWASPSTRTVLGYEPADVVGTNTMDFLHPDDRPLASAVRAQIGSGEAARGVVARIRLADGGYRYMSLASQPVLDEAGAVVGAVGGMKDVDDLVRARMQVEHERALLRASTDSMLDPQILLEAVRDDGRADRRLHVRRPQPGGVRVPATDPRRSCSAPGCSRPCPGLGESGLLARHVEVVETGVPYLITGFRYSNELLGEERYYDIRGVTAGPDLLSLTWSDVTERMEADRVVEASAEKYRLLAENVSDVVVHVRDWTGRLGVPVRRARVRCSA